MASQGSSSDRGPYSYDVAAVLGDSRYRRILSILLDRSQPLPRRELGMQIAAQEADVPPDELPETASKSVRIALAHRYLPKLQELGWVDRTPDGLAATAPQLSPTDALLLPSLQDPEHPHWEPVSALLSRRYRIVLVALLADRQQPLPLEQLAAQLSEYGHLSWVHSLPDQQELSEQLYHVDVPKLVDAGLVAFDTAARTVTPTPLASDIVANPAPILE